MFQNVNARIKLSAWAVLIFGGLCSLILGIVCFVMAGQLNATYYGINGLFGGYSRGGAPGTGLVFLGIFIIIFGGIISYVAALLVHGYAQIVKNTSEMAGKTEEEKEPSLKELFSQAFHIQSAPQPAAPVNQTPAPQPAAPVNQTPAPQPAAPVYQTPAEQPAAPVYQPNIETPVDPAPAVVEEAAPEAVVPSAADEETAAADAFCPVCGRKVKEGALFCSGCGTKL